jgi:S-adenosylmethionine-diacylglycerol 3-amino-3-carboxypropyl transferase
MLRSEVEDQTDFSIIRYAQCWEDADILLEGLDVKPGELCLSIASAGDNTLSLLTKNPAKVIALDLSPAQIACLELRVAAYRCLSHQELLELVGACASDRRYSLYAKVRSLLSAPCRAFWDQRPRSIAMGVGASGKFERYFRIYRSLVLPLIHRRRTLAAFRDAMTKEQRVEFYDRVWPRCSRPPGQKPLCTTGPACSGQCATAAFGGFPPG